MSYDIILRLEDELEVIWRKKMANIEQENYTRRVLWGRFDEGIVRGAYIHKFTDPAYLHKRGRGEGEDDRLETKWIDNPYVKSFKETVTSSSMFVANIQIGRRVWCHTPPPHANWVSHGLTSAAYLVDPLVIIVVIAIIQTYAAIDPHVLPVKRRIRIINDNRSSSSSCRCRWRKGSEAEQVERPWLQIVLGRTSQNPINPHFPDTGIGATPITYGGNLKNTVVITISATLLTIAQRFRAAQVHYLPHPGLSFPWYMSKAAS
ncbi:hypothetical protein FRC15_010819 [Serendipita sp. 397]|nr:hypothetical protein FRC15_010819 [Serendipita sp. 397]